MTTITRLDPFRSPIGQPRTHSRVCHLLSHLDKPIFVIRFGWRNWSEAARRRWVLNLLNACLDTANECREWLAADVRAHEHDPDRITH